MSAGGTITRRGRNSWRLKFDLERDPARGERRTQYHTVRGSKRDAQAKLVELLATVNKGAYVEPSRLTVAEHVRARVAQWEAAGEVTAATAERYRFLVENQIAPHLGGKLLQKLTTLDIEAWHTTLRQRGRKDGKGGVAARTIIQAHRVLGKALREAVKFNLAAKNVTNRDGQRAPRLDDDEEIDIIAADRLAAVIAALRGHPLENVILVLLFTGLRRGEVLALRWEHVDWQGEVIKVRAAVEETRAHGLRLKTAKTRHGRRDVSMPDVVIEALRAQRRRQQEISLALGHGRIADDALIFGDPVENDVASPRSLSEAWLRLADRLSLPVTLHALRHTHASQLIDAGVDVVTISKRLGHASPAITLKVYAHLFQQRDSKAAAAINRALAHLQNGQKTV